MIPPACNAAPTFTADRREQPFESQGQGLDTRCKLATGGTKKTEKERELNLGEGREAGRKRGGIKRKHGSRGKGAQRGKRSWKDKRNTDGKTDMQIRGGM